MLPPLGPLRKHSGPRTERSSTYWIKASNFVVPTVTKIVLFSELALVVGGMSRGFYCFRALIVPFFFGNAFCFISCAEVGEEHRVGI